MFFNTHSHTHTLTHPTERMWAVVMSFAASSGYVVLTTQLTMRSDDMAVVQNTHTHAAPHLQTHTFRLTH